MQQRQYQDSIFWVEIEKIKPNPYQPRREFDEAKLKELADSIRQYGLLQPLVVTRKEFEREDGGLSVEYEIIAGERRLRASKLAGLSLLPVIIRSGEETDQMKLELAIIENLHREDLNSVDRAIAFKKLVDEFGYKHGQVAKKIGKSREYVSNTIRILTLPEEVLRGLQSREITEGMTRPLMMLSDKPEEQQTLYREIITKKLTVREAEGIARRIAVDRARKHPLNPEMMALEKQLSDTLGTRVTIQQRNNNGGKLVIDYFSSDDIHQILEKLNEERKAQNAAVQESALVAVATPSAAVSEPQQGLAVHALGSAHAGGEAPSMASEREEEQLARDDVPEIEESSDDDEELYSLKNFTV